jgi:hypothetical protein
VQIILPVTPIDITHQLIVIVVAVVDSFIFVLKGPAHQIIFVVWLNRPWLRHVRLFFLHFLKLYLQFLFILKVLKQPTIEAYLSFLYW